MCSYRYDDTHKFTKSLKHTEFTNTSVTRITDKDHWFDMSIRDLTWATVATKLATLPPIFGGLICLSCPLVCVLLSTYCVRPTFPRPTVPRKNNVMNYLLTIPTVGGVMVKESSSRSQGTWLKS